MSPGMILWLFFYAAANAGWLVLWRKATKERREAMRMLREAANLNDTFRVSMLELDLNTERRYAAFVVDDKMIGEMRGVPAFTRLIRNAISALPGVAVHVTWDDLNQEDL